MPPSSLIPNPIKFFSGWLSAATATALRGSALFADQAAPLGVLEHESHGPARPTLTRVVPRTARANKGLSHNSYGSCGVAMLMSGARAP